MSATSLATPIPRAKCYDNNQSEIKSESVTTRVLLNKCDVVTVNEKHKKHGGNHGIVDRMTRKFVYFVVDGAVEEIKTLSSSLMHVSSPMSNRYSGWVEKESGVPCSEEEVQ
jgi:hypothetical protein